MIINYTDYQAPFYEILVQQVTTGCPEICDFKKHIPGESVVC